MNRLDNSEKINEDAFNGKSIKCTLFIISVIYYWLMNIVSLIALSFAELIRYGAALADIIIIALGFNAWFGLKDKLIKKSLLLFSIISTITYLYNKSTVGLLMHINGLREPLVFLCALIFISKLLETNEKEKIVQRFVHLFWFLAIIQIPISWMQFSMYGAGDLVGGSLSTGGSGIVTLALFLITFFFIQYYTSTANGNSFQTGHALLFLVLLFPTLINQTKVSFVLLPIMLGVMLDFRRRMMASLAMVTVSVIGLVILAVVYINVVSPDFMEAFTKEGFESYYLADNIKAGDIPRFGKMAFLFVLFSDNALNYIFGMGYGLMKGQNIIGVSDIGSFLEPLFQGSRMQFFTTFLQGGLLATILFVGVSFAGLYRRKNMQFTFTHRAFRLFLAAVMAIIWIYNDALWGAPFGTVAAFFLAWSRNPTEKFLYHEPLETAGKDRLV